MSDTTISCPHCQQQLEVPADLLGQIVACPECDQSIQLPAPTLPPAAAQEKILVRAPKKIVVHKRKTSSRSSRRPRRPAPQPTPSSEFSAPQGCAIITVVAILSIPIGYWLSGGCEAPSGRPTPTSSYTMPAPKPKAWYSGGTLHSATMAEWRRASYENRLATCADFITGTMQMDGKTIPPVDTLRPRAYGLEVAISTAQREGVPDTMSVAEVAAGCLVLMEQM